MYKRNSFSFNGESPSLFKVKFIIAKVQFFIEFIEWPTPSRVAHPIKSIVSLGGSPQKGQKGGSLKETKANLYNAAHLHILYPVRQ
jgi:hypothetical protein